MEIGRCSGAGLRSAVLFLVTQRLSVPPRVVKEEISDDNAKLPCFNGRVVSWVSERDGALVLFTKMCARSQLMQMCPRDASRALSTHS